MSKFYVQTKTVTSIIKGTYMFIDGDTLFVYNGETLIGMYKTEYVITAYMTEAI